MRAPRVPIAVAICPLLATAFAIWEGYGREETHVWIQASWLYAALGMVCGCLIELLLRIFKRTSPRIPFAWIAGTVGIALILSFRQGNSLTRPAGNAVHPDIVLLTCDTTRADRWWAVADLWKEREGQGLPWESQALLFPKAYTTVGLTAPAHASLFTGMHPHQHGLLNNGGWLPPHRTLPQALQEAGYTTMAAPAVIHLDPGFGFARHFDKFSPVEDGWRARLRPMQRFLVVRQILRWLGAGVPVRLGRDSLLAAVDLWQETSGDRPRFLWAHIFEPHWPYDPEDSHLKAVADIGAWQQVPTPGFEADSVRDWQRRYDAEIYEGRQLLRNFVDTLVSLRGHTDRPLWIILTSDHGEALGERGTIDHGDLPYEEQLRVPFWIYASDKTPLLQNREVEEAISHVDFFPSLMDLLDLPVPAGLPGRSWAKCLDGAALEPMPVYGAARHRHFDNAMVRWKDFKLIQHLKQNPSFFLTPTRARPAAEVPDNAPWLGTWEAYDLGQDELELRCLKELGSEQARLATQFLNEFQEERGPALEKQDPQQNLSPDIVDALQQLGY